MLVFFIGDGGEEEAKDAAEVDGIVNLDDVNISKILGQMLNMSCNCFCTVKALLLITISEVCSSSSYSANDNKHDQHVIKLEVLHVPKLEVLLTLLIYFKYISASSPPINNLEIGRIIGSHTCCTSARNLLSVLITLEVYVFSLTCLDPLVVYFLFFVGLFVPESFGILLGNRWFKVISTG